LNALLLSLALLVPPPAGLDTDPILDAIRAVETGGEADPANAVGDGGRALGPFQIHYSYWLDATERRPDLRALGYQSVRDQAVAEQIVLAYLTRYAPDWNVRTVARIHNGGPRGHKKAATVKYANAVEAAIN
jgi:hypothetical protein